MIWRDRCLIEGPPSGAVISIGAKSGRPRAVTAAACNAPANRPGCSPAKPLSRCPASSRYVRPANQRFCHWCPVLAGEKRTLGMSAPGG